MNIQLAKNEVLVKNWDYSRTNTKTRLSRNTIFNELVVTNKRIISRESDKNRVSTQELFMEDVKGVGGMYATKRNIVIPILLVILAVAAAGFAVYAYFFMHAKDFAIFAAVGAAALLLIALLVYIFSRQTCFMLNLTTGDYVGNSLDLSSGVAAYRDRKQKNQRHVQIKVKVSYSAAEEIVNTIGACIIDGRQS